MKKITLFTLVAIFSMAFIGCETTKETNSNKAIVVNSNTAANMSNSNMMSSNTMTSTNSNMTTTTTTTTNRDITRADYDRDRSRYEQEAKASGRTIGSGVNDSWLWTKTRAALATTAGLRDSTIDVDVTNDVVTLSGTVGTKEQQQMAVKTAQEIDGVKSVKNNLKVSATDSLTNQMTGSNSNTTTRTNTNKR